jgi:hypothetical protein
MNTEILSAKEYLSQAYRIDQRINSKLEQAQSLRELSERATMTLSDMPGSGTRNVHRMDGIITKMVDLETEISDDLNRLLDLKHEIVTMVKCVEIPELQTLLDLRYLCFRTWEDISMELHYDIRHIRRMHSRALDEIDSIRCKGCP